jgi:hypothetical protein
LKLNPNSKPSPKQPDSLALLQQQATLRQFKHGRTTINCLQAVVVLLKNEIDKFNG